MNGPRIGLSVYCMSSVACVWFILLILFLSSYKLLSLCESWSCLWRNTCWNHYLVCFFSFPHVHVYEDNCLFRLKQLPIVATQTESCLDEQFWLMWKVLWCTITLLYMHLRKLNTHVHTTIHYVVVKCNMYIIRQ